jgi:magnesium-transporting ATPase (P-type)
MFNALNALSDESSIFKVGIFSNMYLIVAIFGSVMLHFMILYVPFFEKIFGTVPLTQNDWIIVLAVSAPVVVLDEVLKFFSRMRTNNALASRPHRKEKSE